MKPNESILKEYMDYIRHNLIMEDYEKVDKLMKALETYLSAFNIIPLHPQKREETKMIEKIELIKYGGSIVISDETFARKINELLDAINELKANNPKGNK